MHVQTKGLLDFGADRAIANAIPAWWRRWALNGKFGALNPESLKGCYIHWALLLLQGVDKIRSGDCRPEAHRSQLTGNRAAA